MLAPTALPSMPRRVKTPTAAGLIWPTAPAGRRSAVTAGTSPIATRRSVVNGSPTTFNYLCNELGATIPCGAFWDATACPSDRCVYCYADRACTDASDACIETTDAAATGTTASQTTGQPAACIGLVDISAGQCDPTKGLRCVEPFSSDAGDCLATCCQEVGFPIVVPTVSTTGPADDCTALGMMGCTPPCVADYTTNQCRAFETCADYRDQFACEDSVGCEFDLNTFVCYTAGSTTASPTTAAPATAAPAAEPTTKAPAAAGSTLASTTPTPTTVDPTPTPTTQAPTTVGPTSTPTTAGPTSTPTRGPTTR